MNKEIFKNLIIDNQERIKKINPIKRDYVFFEDSFNLNKIITFVWPRRVWKTFLMFQFVKQLLLDEKIKESQLVFIDFSQFRNEKINPQIVLDSYFETNLDDPFFIFDEIQDIENFTEFVLFFYNKWYKIFLSWSNSKLLSSEIATEFSWRIFQYDVLPLTFKEVLKFKNIENKKNYSTKEKWELNNILEEILIFWTYPEIILSKEDLFKENLIKDYLDILVYKDLIDRYKIDNEYVVKFLVKKIISTNTKEISVNKVFNDLKSLNIKVWKNTIYNYLEYSENIFFQKQIKNFFSQNGFKKNFLYNLWFRNSFSNEKDFWKQFENFIFLNLLKNNKNIFFKKWSWKLEWEVDFFIEEKDLNIQVCYDLNDENLRREIKSLKNTKNNFLIIKNNSLSEEKNKKIPENIKIINWLDFLNN